MTLSHKEKIEIMKSLNWDYKADPEEMLSVVEGKAPIAGAFDSKKLFVRSLERLPWHKVILLWGLEKADKMYTKEISRRLWPKEIRRRYNFVFGILRKENVPVAEWGSKNSRKMQNTLLSNRWYRIK